MRKAIFTIIALAVTMTTSQASGWQRVSCEYEMGTGYVGTYVSGYGSGKYTRTLAFKNYCPFSL